ncbi:Uncharacterised protein [Gordonia terrae]|nr:Uncharacterised protein [Clostridioides difficile]VTS40098.1 Uncharacterised protein [Gordonia terrae]
MIRWWDGYQWTANRQPTPPPSGPFPPYPQRKKSGAAKPLLIIGGSLFAFLLVVGSCTAVIGSSGGDSSSSSARSSSTVTADESGSVTVFAPDPSAAAAASRSAVAAREQRDREFRRLTNKASYRNVTSRDWQLVAKNPDAHKGELYVIYGRVVQADAATGTFQIRVNTDGQQVDLYDFDINTIVTTGLASFKEVVEDDLVTLWVGVTGSETYDTTMGGSVTAPKVEANIVEVYGNAG